MRRYLTIIIAALAVATQLNITAAEARPSSVVIAGHGWGHGRGLGQWGARGMAASGMHWRSIVHHYYSGVRISGIKRLNVRVLLEHRTGFAVASHNPFRAVALGHTIARSSDALRFMRVSTAGDGKIVLAKGPNGSGPWKVVHVTGARKITFVPGTSMMQVKRSSGLRWYRGRIVAQRKARHLLMIDNVGLENYVRGVIPREMPAMWPIEALKAQAVAARSYALRVTKVARSRGAVFDICATTACQVYGGYAWLRNGRRVVLEHPRSNAAVAATRQRVMTYEGSPILAEYSSSTGGWSRSSTVFPYMRSVRDRYDARSPHHAWRVTVPSAAIEATWPSIGRLAGVRVLERTASYARGGHASLVEVRGTQRTVRIGGSAFRSALGLKSTWFAIAGASSGTRYRFTFNMGYGLRHPAVAELQRRLRAGGYFPNRSITTYFGDITRGAVRKYQAAHGIQTTGYVGPKTRAALNS